MKSCKYYTDLFLKEKINRNQKETKNELETKREQTILFHLPAQITDPKKSLSWFWSVFSLIRLPQWLSNMQKRRKSTIWLLELNKKEYD